MNKPFKSFFSLICVVSMLFFTATASAVDFSPGATSQVDYTLMTIAIVDTGVAVAASGHQCGSCHAGTPTSKTDLIPTPSSAPGGDPVLLVSPTSKADMPNGDALETAIDVSALPVEVGWPS